jgi:hypothetical protein
VFCLLSVCLGTITVSPSSFILANGGLITSRLITFTASSAVLADTNITIVPTGFVTVDFGNTKTIVVRTE